MSKIEPIIKAYREGQAACFVSGRSLYDLVIEDGQVKQLFNILRQTLRQEYGMVFLNYWKGGGFNWFENSFAEEADRQTVREVLRTHNLLELPTGEDEAVAVMRGIASLARTNTDLNWQNGNPMRFAVCFEFSEHLAPGSLQNGTQTDPQIIFTEIVHITSQSLALRNSENLIIFHGRDSLVDELVCGAIKQIRLPQPDMEEKREFVETALTAYDKAVFEDELSVDGVVSLTVNTPNRGIEGLLRASHRDGRIITAKEIGEQKNRDVEQLSEGTLAPLDTNRVKDLRLIGKNIAVPYQILMKLGDGLLQGNSKMPANVLLAGAPGTAKTDLAILTARRGRVPAYQMLSPKDSFVGSTERKARLQQQALREWIPNLGFSDEITESLPLERNGFDGDSGASKAVTAELLTQLSDETRRGKSLLIATSNRPWQMGAAMRSRFTIVPVLYPLLEDFPEIIIEIVRRISPECILDPSCQEIIEAARIFYQKGASPRHIRNSLTNHLLITNRSGFKPEDVLTAARDLCPTTDFDSTIYADLMAVKYCASRAFFPWSDDPGGYSFPDHLKGIIDERTGDVIESALNTRLAELEPKANV